jgi:urea transporter
MIRKRDLVTDSFPAYLVLLLSEPRRSVVLSLCIFWSEWPFALQLVVWFLRGVSRVILANNPLSGALILAALLWASPWQGVLGTVGVLASMLTAVLIGQDG